VENHTHILLPAIGLAEWLPRTLCLNPIEKSWVPEQHIIALECSALTTVAGIGKRVK